MTTESEAEPDISAVDESVDQRMSSNSGQVQQNDPQENSKDPFVPDDDASPGTAKSDETEAFTSQNDPKLSSSKDLESVSLGNDNDISGSTVTGSSDSNNGANPAVHDLPVVNSKGSPSVAHDENSNTHASESKDDTNVPGETSYSQNDDTLLAEGDSELHFDRHGLHEARIVSAGKDTDTGGSFIVYEIEFHGKTVRHRYSHFDQLRKVLEAMYPALIVPPLPEKNSLASFAALATSTSRGRTDGELVEKRMRLLQDFLNRCLAHPILKEASPFHRFLDGETPWQDVMRLPPVSYLPTNPLRGLVRNPTDTRAQELLVALPTPSSMQPLQTPDERFIDSEVFTNRFSAHVSGSMEQTNRRSFKRLQSTIQGLYDLAITAQGLLLTLEEQPSKLDGRNTFAEKRFTPAVAQLCKSFQTTQNNTSRLLEMWNIDFSEVLHLYGQYSEIIKKLLKFRLRRHLQYEATHEALVSKRALLAELEATEAEVLRVDRLVESSLSATPGTETPTDAESREDLAQSQLASSDTFVPITSSAILQANEDLKARSNHRYAGHLHTNFLGALSNTFSNFVDADPAQRRRESIDKSRQSIAVLEGCLEELTQDLKYTCTAMQGDLDRFQRQKVRDISTMCLDFSKMHRLHAARNLEAWKEAKAAIERMH